LLHHVMPKSASLVCCDGSKKKSKGVGSKTQRDGSRRSIHCRRLPQLKVDTLCEHYYPSKSAGLFCAACGTDPTLPLTTTKQRSRDMSLSVDFACLSMRHSAAQAKGLDNYVY